LLHSIKLNIRARTTIVSTLIAAGVAASLTAQAPGTVPAGTLPSITGRFAVGMTEHELIDSSRMEWAPDHSRRRRTIPITVLYPAEADPSPPAPYLPEATVLAANGLLGPNSQLLAARIRRAARLHAPPAQAPAGFPVVIFSPGRGERAAWYTALHEELASHGVIVVVVAHAGMADVVLRDRTLVRNYPAIWDPKPEGWDARLDSTASIALRRAVYDSFYTSAAEYLHGDLTAVLEHVTADGGLPLGQGVGIHVDTAALITGGHSYGANVAIEACHRDPRVRGCYSLDGGAFGPVREHGLRRPYLLVRPAYENDGTPRGLAQDQLFGSMRNWAWEVNVMGANHRSFMDAPFWAERSSGDSSATQPHVITSRAIRAFIDGVRASPSGLPAPPALPAGAMIRMVSVTRE
jgi:hypothetical protein